MIETALSFSVVIPVYNGSPFIVKAIDSCLQQTVLPDEIIVIDDASDDNTHDFVLSINSPLVKYSRNPTNSGPSFSRNRGMQLASSSWILFLDADDIFHPKKIEVICYYLQQNKMIRAIGHSFTTMGNTALSVTDNWKGLAVKKLVEKEVLFRNPMVTPALAVSASNNIYFNEAMGYAEDHDFILRTTETHRIYYVDIPLCSLQRLPLTPGGISSDRWKMRKGEMHMYVDYCKRHNKYLAIPFLVAFSMLKHLKYMIFPINNIYTQ